jgi:hypothetical protein
VDLADEAGQGEEICALVVAKDCVRAGWYRNVVESCVQLVEVGAKSNRNNLDKEPTQLLYLAFWWLGLRWSVELGFIFGDFGVLWWRTGR